MTTLISVNKAWCVNQSATDVHMLNEAGPGRDAEIELANKTRYKQVGGGDESMMKNNRKVEKRWRDTLQEGGVV